MTTGTVLRRLIAMGSAFLILTSWAPARAFAAVAHDDFANAQVLAAPYAASFDTSGATSETNEPNPLCPDGSSAIADTIWFRFDANADDPYDVRAGASFASGETDMYLPKVAIWDGSGLGDLALIACAHASVDGFASVMLTFEAAAGHTYWIQVGNDPSDVGHAAGGYGQFDFHLQRPVATVAPLPAVTMHPTFPVSWSAVPGAGAITGYDVWYFPAPWDGNWVEWKRRWTGTTSTTGTFIGAPGTYYCFSVYAFDDRGSQSYPAENACTTVPVDDRVFIRSPGWRAGTGSNYYLGTYLSSSTNHATLTRTRIRAREISLVATTCPTCGKVRVYWNGVVLKTVDLHSPSTRYRQVLPVARFPDHGRSGTLRLEVWGAGKRVVIDGVANPRL